MCLHSPAQVRFVYAFKADGALAPSPVIKVNVVQDAGPAIHVATLCDLACNTQHNALV